MTRTAAFVAQIGLLNVILCTPIVTAQLADQQFYLLRGDGLLYTGRFGTNVSQLVGDAGLAPSPGTGNGLAGALAFDANGSLYALGGSSTDSAPARLARLDRSDASSTTVTQFDSFFAPALAIDNDGIAYVYENNLSQQYYTRIDTATGQILSRIERTPGDPLMTGWTGRSDGLLFGTDVTGQFFTIDPLAGIVQDLGFGFSGGDIDGFATIGDRTYFGNQRVGGAFDVYSIDLFSGAYQFELTITGEHESPGNIFGFAIIPTPSVLTIVAPAFLVGSRRRR